MINNFYFTNHKEILTRLSRKFKGEIFNADEVHDWCAELENDILREHDYFVKFLRTPIPIVNKRFITIPCNLHSVIDVYTEGGIRPNFTNMIKNIELLNDYDDEFIYIDYKGTPIDESTGDVLILRGHELACEWHCIKNHFTEPYLNGKLDGQRWGVITDEYENAINVATMDMRRMSKKDFNTMEVILGNKLPMLGRVPLYTKGGF